MSMITYGQPIILSDEGRPTFCFQSPFATVTPNVAPLVISHTWTQKLISDSVSKYAPAHSATFSSKDLPGVVFQLFAAMCAPRNLTVHLTKSSSLSANVILKIDYDGMCMISKDVNDWTHNQIIQEVAAPQSKTHPFVVSIHLTWLGFSKESNRLQPCNLYRHLKCLYETGDLADFTIAVGDEEICTHKAILASQSPKFMGMFKSGMRESVHNRLVITHIEFGIMKKVVEFLYTSEIDPKLGVNDLLSILAVADEYEIVDLKNLAQCTLCTKITIDNVLEILEGANLYGAPKLVEESVVLMVYNKKAIIKLPQFKDLYDRNPGILYNFFVRIAEA